MINLILVYLHSYHFSNPNLSSSNSLHPLHLFVFVKRCKKFTTSLEHLLGVAHLEWKLDLVT